MLQFPDCGSGPASPPRFPAADSCVRFREVAMARGAFSSYVNHWPCDHRSPLCGQEGGLRELSAVARRGQPVALWLAVPILPAGLDWSRPELPWPLGRTGTASQEGS